MSAWIKVATQSEVPNGRSKMVGVGDRQLAVFHINNELHVIDNICPHRGAPLADGEMEGTIVTCPWHGWEFDVATGKSPINPSACVQKFTVKLEDDDILIEMKAEDD